MIFCGAATHSRTRREKKTRLAAEEVQKRLRSGALTSRTLNDALRLGKDRASRAECVDILPCLIASLVRVDTRHAAGRVRERLGQTFNRAKVHLESHRDDERIVGELAARVCADRVARRVKGRDVLGNMRDVLRDQSSGRSAECRLLLQAGADEGPIIRSASQIPLPEKLIGRTIQAVLDGGVGVWG
jgi:hypothetical protein